MAARRFSVHFYDEDLIAIESYRHRLGFTTKSKAIQAMILTGSHTVLLSAAGGPRGQSVSISVDMAAWERIQKLMAATGMQRGQLLRTIVRATAVIAASPQVAVEA